MKKNTLFILPVIAGTLLALASCASTKTETKLNKVYVTNTTKVDLLPVSAIADEIDKYQLFQGTFGDKQMNAQAYVKANQDGIEVVLMNDFGGEVGTISYDGVNATMESSIIPEKMKPEYIILDLQNAYASTEKLKEHYSKYDLEFAEIKTNITTNNGGIRIAERAIAKDGKVIETITIGNGVITITNLLRGYEYRLTTAE